MNLEHRIQNQRLFIAAAFNDINMARLALQRGADINTQDHFSRQSPLMVAAMHHHFDLVRFFVENGANVLLTDNNGQDAEDHTLTIPDFDDVHNVARIRDYLHRRIRARRNVARRWQLVRDDIVNNRHRRNQAIREGAPENQIEYILSESGEQRTRANKKRLNEVIKQTNKRLRGLEFGKRKVRLTLKQLKKDLKKVS
jgi:hypothetical protein